MCATCGCGAGEEGTRMTVIGKTNLHYHEHNGIWHSHALSDGTQEHNHDHNHELMYISHMADHQHMQIELENNHIVQLEKDILHKNDLLAERNRGYFEALKIFTINLVSSPGSGKTSVLERTLADLKAEIKFSVIEGDQQTTNDADRIDALKIPVVQINTGKGCHLDSEMISKAVKELSPENNSILMIENVGNLVCPAMFDLGEACRVVIISVTEGEDKPLKYPDMFYGSQVCIINKIDLLPYIKFDLEALKNNAKKVNPSLTFFEVSATTGEGMQAWYQFLRKSINQ